MSLHFAVILLLLFAKVTVPSETESLRSNADIYVEEIVEALSGFEFVEAKIDQRIYLESNLSEEDLRKIRNNLAGQGASVSLSSTSWDLKIIISVQPNNSLSYIKKNLALRKLEASVDVLALKTDSTLFREEKHLINRVDTLLRQDIFLVIGNFPYQRFQAVQPYRNKMRLWLEPTLVLLGIGVSMFLLFNVRGS